MERVTNAELADMHLAYGTANGNSEDTVARYPNRHVAAHQSFVSIHLAGKTEWLSGRNYWIFLNEVLPELLKNVPLLKSEECGSCTLRGCC